MAVFDSNDEAMYGRLDWQILKNGWSGIIRQPAVVDQCAAWFDDEGYRVVEFDCRGWTDDDVMHAELAAKLDFPSYYGRNLDALNDCLRSMPLDEPGLLIVLRNFEAAPANEHGQLLDILAGSSRMHLLFGKRLLTLAQTNDWDLRVEPVGACSVPWLSR